MLALTHMRDTIVTIKQPSKENQADHRRQPHITPIAVITELEQDIRGIAVFGRQPEWDYDGEYAAEVQCKQQVLDQRKSAGQRGVHHHGECTSCYGEEGAVPSLKGIIRIVERDEALDHYADHQGRASQVDLPGYYNQPAD